MDRSDLKVVPDHRDAKGAIGSFANPNFGKDLVRIFQVLRKNSYLKDGLTEEQAAILRLLDVDDMMLYQRGANGKELLNYFRSGKGRSLDTLDPVVPCRPTTPAGYVAANLRPLVIQDVHDSAKLASIHPQLQWYGSGTQSAYPRVQSLLLVPVREGKQLMGVLQLMSVEGFGDLPRDKVRVSNALTFARTLAKLMRSDVNASSGPYDHLIKMGRITHEQLVEALRSIDHDSRKISHVLQQDYEIEADEIGASLEKFYCVPYMKYDEQLRPPACFMDHIEVNYLRKNCWVPVEGDKYGAVILIDDPTDQQRIFEIGKIINARKYDIRIGLPDDIMRYLEDDPGEVEENSISHVIQMLGEGQDYHIEEELERKNRAKEEKLASSSAIIQLVKRIIIESYQLGASDIHIEPHDERSAGVVRVRVDGFCRKLLEIPQEYLAAVVTRIKVISRMDVSERRLTQDGKCVETIRGRKIELRVATFPTAHGESAVLRILSHGNALPLHKLNLSDANLAKVKKLASNLHGMFLVVGPTGSGKTTTLHSVIGHLNKPDIKIWTAEDPIEITQPGLQQIQVKPKIGLTFASVLRGFLRGDPDVILVGEMRDRETAGVAVEGSLTGHLVLSTLHSNSAPETITRLLNFGMEPVNFSDALLGIMAQRLVRTLCRHCKEPYRPTARELEFLIKGYGEEYFPELGLSREDMQLYRPVGCGHCENSGYHGRTGIHELLIVSRELHEMIFNQCNVLELRDQAIKDGMRTLKQDGIQKIFLGLTDYTQLNRVIPD